MQEVILIRSLPQHQHHNITSRPFAYRASSFQIFILIAYHQYGSVCQYNSIGISLDIRTENRNTASILDIISGVSK
jgi:hypothetical protein